MKTSCDISIKLKNKPNKTIPSKETEIAEIAAFGIDRKRIIAQSLLSSINTEKNKKRMQTKIKTYN